MRPCWRPQRELPRPFPWGLRQAQRPSTPLHPCLAGLTHFRLPPPRCLSQVPLPPESRVGWELQPRAVQDCQGLRIESSGARPSWVGLQLPRPEPSQYQCISCQGWRGTLRRQAGEAVKGLAVTMSPFSSSCHSTRLSRLNIKTPLWLKAPASTYSPFSALPPHLQRAASVLGGGDYLDF